MAQHMETTNNQTIDTIKKSIIRWINNSFKRKKELVLIRLKIRHTRLTHGYLMAMEEPALPLSCEVCGVHMIVNHTILDVALRPET